MAAATEEIIGPNVELPLIATVQNLIFIDKNLPGRGKLLHNKQPEDCQCLEFASQDASMLSSIPCRNVDAQINFRRDESLPEKLV